MTTLDRKSPHRNRFSLHACIRAASLIRLGPILALGFILLGVPARAQLSVSDSGSPSYGQAIAVPPGQAGMSPKIGLLYAGSGVNGPVGYGWSVQGLSMITRCAPNRAIDGVRGAVTNTASDKLCLDGQRLIQTDATGAPLAFPQTNDALGMGAGYREFRTEKDSYARIRAYGYANSDTTGASGPAYFKVWTKSGQIYEYGAIPSADANTRALISPYQKTVATGWSVAHISDTLGNFIDFKYEQRDVQWGSGTTAGSPAWGHEWNLLEIQYSGNKVVFTYADRASKTPQDSAEAYHQAAANCNGNWACIDNLRQDALEAGLPVPRYSMKGALIGFEDWSTTPVRMFTGYGRLADFGLDTLSVADSLYHGTDEWLPKLVGNVNGWLMERILGPFEKISGNVGAIWAKATEKATSAAMDRDKTGH